MKKLLLIALVCLASAALRAQNVYTKPAFSIGAEVGFPTNSIYKVGFGGSAKAEVPLTSELSLSITGGYTSFPYKKAYNVAAVSQDASGFIPLKAGARFFLSESFYFEGDAGVAIETNYNKDKLFAFSVGPGFVVATGKHTGVDFGFRYENWGSGRLRQTALRVSYRFGW